MHVHLWSNIQNFSKHKNQYKALLGIRYTPHAISRSKNGLLGRHVWALKENQVHTVFVHADKILFVQIYLCFTHILWEAVERPLVTASSWQL